MPDGLLIIDKPSGPTSHDVVARVRRALREKAIGHTGTLDPMATGVLVLVVGKATRLAKFLSASAKSYEAKVRFGFATDTADAQGRPIGSARDRPMPSREAIDAALDAFRGTFMQQPPAFSAKKIDGERSYKLARNAGRNASRSVASDPPALPDLPDLLDLPAPPALPDPPAPPALPAPCSVTTTRLEIVNVEADCVTLSVDCSAGFYVRSLAHDLGERLGVGAHLTLLRRTRVGEFGLDRAVTLDAVERDPQVIASSIVPLAGALPGLPAVVLTSEGAGRVSHGQDVRPADQLSAVSSQPSAMGDDPSRLRSPDDPASYGEARQSAEGATAAALSPLPFVRLVNAAGELLAVAEPTGSGALHPSVVLV